MPYPVVHFEVNGRDVEKLHAFYGELFGWKTQSVPGMSYVLVEKEGNGIAGGLGQTENGSEGFVTFYVQAEDPEAVLQRAEGLGGKTLMEVTELPQVTLGMFADPEGHVIGIVKAG